MCIAPTHTHTQSPGSASQVFRSKLQETTSGSAKLHYNPELEAFQCSFNWIFLAQSCAFNPCTEKEGKRARLAEKERVTGLWPVFWLATPLLSHSARTPHLLASAFHLTAPSGLLYHNCHFCPSPSSRFDLFTFLFLSLFIKTHHLQSARIVPLLISLYTLNSGGCSSILIHHI